MLICLLQLPNFTNSFTATLFLLFLWSILVLSLSSKGKQSSQQGCQLYRGSVFNWCSGMAFSLVGVKWTAKLLYFVAFDVSLRGCCSCHWFILAGAGDGTFKGTAGVLEPLFSPRLKSVEHWVILQYCRQYAHKSAYIALINGLYTHYCSKVWGR